MTRPFKVLGIQQIAIGGPSKEKLRSLWVDMLGLTITGNFVSERENVDEDIATLGTGAHRVEVDLMQPIDPEKKPAVHTTPLNHIGLWIDDLAAAVEWLTGQGVRFAPGGLPRVTELFEARNPSNPAVVSEIDGIVSYGGIKRGNREIVITSRDGEVKKYLVPLSKHILVQDNDFIKAGDALSDGAITPSDILAIKGPAMVQEYLVNEVQEVYRLQGVKINDKHFWRYAEIKLGA